MKMGKGKRVPANNEMKRSTRGGTAHSFRPNNSPRQLEKGGKRIFCISKRWLLRKKSSKKETQTTKGKKATVKASGPSNDSRGRPSAINPGSAWESRLNISFQEQDLWNAISSRSGEEEISVQLLGTGMALPPRGEGEKGTAGLKGGPPAALNAY